MPARFAPRRLLLLVQALLALLIARLLLAGLPFTVLARLLGSAKAPPLTPDPRGQADPRVGDIGWSVQAAARRVPWRSTCLVQAVATAGLLTVRGIEYRLWLGLSRMGGGLQAHAWVSCGERVVVGEAGHKAFTPVASFAQSYHPGHRRAASV